MADEPTISYDDEYDILYVHSGGQAMDTIQRGNFVVELDSRNQVVGVEIEQASNTFSELLDDAVTAEDLSNVREAEIKVRQQANVAFVVLAIAFERDGQTVRETLPVNLSSGTMATA